MSQTALHRPETVRDFITRAQHAADTINEQITFTGDYQHLGITDPVWQNVTVSVHKAEAVLPMRNVNVETDLAHLEIFVDPLFEKVFYNLIDNSLRYGGDRMTTIRISAQESDASLSIIFEDNGAGIPVDDKKHLFSRGFGKNTGLGLFLSREILSITGMTIMENGVPGRGVRFEITVPKGGYRFRKGPV